MLDSGKLNTAADLENAFNRWHFPIYGYVYGRVGNRQIAEDLTQEAFIKAWKYRDSFDPRKSSLKNWLFVITVNLVRDHFRKFKNHIPSELDDNFPGSGNVASETSDRQMISFVFHQLKKLSTREQELLLLRYQEDLTIEEIANIFEMGVSATKVAIHRAMKRLRRFCN